MILNLKIGDQVLYVEEEALARLPKLHKACVVWHVEGRVPRAPRQFSALVKFLQGYDLSAEEESDAAEEADCWEASSLGLERLIKFATWSQEIGSLKKSTVECLPILRSALASSACHVEDRARLIPRLQILPDGKSLETLALFQDHLSQPKQFSTSQVDLLKSLGYEKELPCSTVRFYAMGAKQEISSAALAMLPKLQEEIQQTGQSFLIQSNLELECLVSLDKYLSTAQRMPVQQYHFLRTLGLDKKLQLSFDPRLQVFSNILYHGSYHLACRNSYKGKGFYLVKVDDEEATGFVTGNGHGTDVFNQVEKFPFLKVKSRYSDQGFHSCKLVWQLK